MKVILASGSLRRKLIFQDLFNSFEICTPKIEEIPTLGEMPNDFTIRISKLKAESIMGSMSSFSEFLVVSCDTIVTIDNKIIGKPADFRDAISIIQILNGRTHSVISGITLLYVKDAAAISMSESELSHVKFKNLTENEIIAYLKKFDYSDKAGAYAVQEHGNLIIESIQGSVTNVIGFPMRLFFRLLCEMEILDKMPFKTMI